MLTLLTLLSGPAYATSPDMFGLGGRSMGAGGGGVALVEDGTAAWLNPAGLGRIRRPEAGVGFMAGFDSFDDSPDLYWDTNRDGSLDERDAPLQWSTDVENPTGYQLFVGKQIGGKFGLGAAAWLPAQRLYRMSTVEPDLPTYWQYENRPQRYTLAIGVGGEIVRGVNVGASVDMHSRAVFDMYGTANLSIAPPEDPDGEVEQVITDVSIDVHDLVLDLRYAALPVLGVQLEVGRWSEKLDGLVVGVSYRPRLDVSIDADLDIQADVALTDVGDLDPYLVGAVVQADAELFDHTLPRRLALGVAWRTDEVFSAYVDAIWQDWRGARVNVTHLRSAEITSPLADLSDTLRDGNDYEVVMRPTTTFRTGLDLKLPRWELHNDFQYLRLSFRGGFAYVPTPLTAQGENSAFLDSDRTSFTVGAGAEVHDPFDLVDAPVRFDLYAQLHQLGRTTLPRSSATPRAGFPIDEAGIPIGGTIVIIGGQWGFEY